MREGSANFAAACNRANRLRAGHDGDREKFHLMLAEQGQQSLGGFGVEIAVHDGEFFAAFENGKLFVEDLRAFFRPFR